MVTAQQVFERSAPGACWQCGYVKPGVKLFVAVGPNGPGLYCKDHVVGKQPVKSGRG